MAPKELIDSIISLNGTMSKWEMAEHLGLKHHELVALFKSNNIKTIRVAQSAETRELRSTNMKSRHTDLEYRKIATSGLNDLATNRTGKTYEEIYGERADEIISAMKDSHANRPPPSKENLHKRSQSLTGKTRTAEQRAKISNSRIQGFIDGSITLSPKAGFGKGGFREDINHYVRSSYEHKFAIALRSMNVPYLYEHQRYVLDIDGKTKTYTPDFAFCGLIIDIKNSFNSKDESYLKKIDAMLIQHGINVITVVGDHWKTQDQVIESINSLLRTTPL